LYKCYIYYFIQKLRFRFFALDSNTMLGNIVTVYNQKYIYKYEFIIILVIKVFKIKKNLQCLHDLHGIRFEIDFGVLRAVCLCNRCIEPKIIIL